MMVRYANKNIPHENCPMPSRFLDLTVPDHAYMFGFIQADGHLYQTTRGRGKLQIELQDADEYILTRFAALIPCSCTISKRTRTTNFAQGHKSVMLRAYSKGFRDDLVRLGMIEGKKANLVEPPTCGYSKPDYFRGIVDADGSLGTTGNEFPFVSLVTASDRMARAYCDFIKEVIGKQKLTARNKRDQVFNIVVYKEDAQALAASLYYDDCLALPRKQEAAHLILAWQRPNGMRKVLSKKTWASEEDSYILANTIDDAMRELKRTRQSIKMRLWRLRG